MKKIKYFFTKKEDNNLAYHVNDDKQRVDNNHKKLAFKNDYEINNLRIMNQVHGNNIQIVTHLSPRIIPSCDALITKEKNLPLMVMVADCIPILMYDEKKEIIAAIHAGRNSTFLKITQDTALKMIKEFSCKKEDIKVLLGPSIQRCCYEVGEKLVDIVKKDFSDDFVSNKNIDLQAINVKLLRDLGIENINVSNICTKCNGKDYFSYRNNKDCGRFAGIIEIK